ncbi:hypothetical protein ACOME3_001843 [Neoechinorhynchus agilis]
MEQDNRDEDRRRRQHSDESITSEQDNQEDNSLDDDDTGDSSPITSIDTFSPLTTGETRARLLWEIRQQFDNIGTDNVATLIDSIVMMLIASYQLRPRQL